MAAGIYNITIEAYADFDRTFQIKSGASNLDITGYSFAASLRERAQNTTSAADFVCSIVSNTDGKFRVFIANFSLNKTRGTSGFPRRGTSPRCKKYVISSFFIWLLYQCSFHLLIVFKNASARWAAVARYMQFLPLIA